MRAVCFPPSAINCFVWQLLPFIILYLAGCAIFYWRNRKRIAKLTSMRKTLLILLAIAVFYVLSIVLLAFFLADQCI